MIETLPARWYHDPDLYAREQEAIFGRHWLLAGHTGQLPAPSGALATIAGGRRIVLVRRPDGSLGALHNVCRHRAAPLLWDGQVEACAALRCRYHGWRYDLDGRLIATPGFGESFSPEGWGLRPVHLRQWRGLLFVCFAEAPPPLDDVTAGLGEAAALPLEAMVPHSSAQHRVRCNWKTYVENYLEGYHIPWLHPDLSDQIAMRGYRVEVAGRAALHRVPAREGALSRGLWAWLWPNAALNFYGRGMSLERMHPVSPTELEIDYLYLFHPDEPQAARDASLALSAAVTAEDIVISEAVQRNLAAGVYQTGRLSPRHEGGVAAFQAWVRDALRQAQ